MYENRRQTILKQKTYFVRIAKHTATAAVLVGASLFLGILGYREVEDLSWLDATLNESMILGGMGPVSELKTESGKIFASCYALYSGILFLVTTAIVFAPFAHRMLHRFHMD